MIATQAATDAALLSAIRRSCHPLASAADLGPLLERIARKRFVLLGEASHGTAEFYRWRAAITRRLIEEHGFTTVAVEGDWPDCYEIHRFVSGYEGAATDARGALEAFGRWPSWMWANEEVLAFISWLQRWNLGAPAGERVGFYGLDVYSLWDSLRVAVRYVERYDPSSAAIARAAYRCFEPYRDEPHAYARAIAFISERCEEQVVRLLTTFGDPRGVTAQNDSQRKLHVLAPHVALLMAGAAEIGSNLVNETTLEVVAKQLDGATLVFDEFRRIARQRYQDWFPQLPSVVPPGVNAISRPGIEAVLVGYDRDSSNLFTVPKLFSTNSAFDFPPNLHEYGFALSGVVQYALYLLNRLYLPDRSAQDLSALAVYAITETASQDGKVGGPVHVAQITPEGVTQLKDEDVQATVISNEKRATALRGSFYATEGGM